MSPHKMYWEVIPLFLTPGSLSKIGVISSFNVWNNSTSLEPSGSGIFFTGKAYIMDLISLTRIYDCLGFLFLLVLVLVHCVEAFVHFKLSNLLA